MAAMKLSHLSAFEEWYENHAEAFPEPRRLAQQAYCDGRQGSEFEARHEELRANEAERKLERLHTAVHFSLAEFRAAERSHAEGEPMEAATRFQHAMQRLIDEIGYDPSQFTP